MFLTTNNFSGSSQIERCKYSEHSVTGAHRREDHHHHLQETSSADHRHNSTQVLSPDQWCSGGATAETEGELLSPGTCWSLIGQYIKLLISDWFTHIIADLWLVNHSSLTFLQEEAERVLKKSQKFTELVIFYNTRKLHRKALELLRTHSSNPDSPLSGLLSLVRILTSDWLCRSLEDSDVSPEPGQWSRGPDPGV